eukprot:UN34757
MAVQRDAGSQISCSDAFFHRDATFSNSVNEKITANQNAKRLRVLLKNTIEFPELIIHVISQFLTVPHFLDLKTNITACQRGGGNVETLLYPWPMTAWWNSKPSTFSSDGIHNKDKDVTLIVDFSKNVDFHGIVLISENKCCPKKVLLTSNDCKETIENERFKKPPNEDYIWPGEYKPCIMLKKPFINIKKMQIQILENSWGQLLW